MMDSLLSWLPAQAYLIIVSLTDGDELSVLCGNIAPMNEEAATNHKFTEAPLTADHILTNRTYITSRFVTMRGTVAFERLNCSSTSNSTESHTFIRLLLNDAVYPIPSCQAGPGKSCPLDSYVNIVEAKLAAAGDLISRCNVTAAGSPSSFKGAGFFTDLTGEWIDSVVP